MERATLNSVDDGSFNLHLDTYNLTSRRDKDIKLNRIAVSEEEKQVVSQWQSPKSMAKDHKFTKKMPHASVTRKVST